MKTSGTDIIPELPLIHPWATSTAGSCAVAIALNCLGDSLLYSQISEGGEDKDEGVADLSNDCDYS